MKKRSAERSLLSYILVFTFIVSMFAVPVSANGLDNGEGSPLQNQNVQISITRTGGTTTGIITNEAGTQILGNASTPAVVPAGTIVRVDAGSNPGHTFTGWTASPAVNFSSPSAIVTTFTALATTTVRANWTVTPPPQGTRTLTLRSSTGGRVSINTGAYANTVTAHFVPGTRVNIHAWPNRNYYFDRWSRHDFADIDHPWRESTSFVMPNRDITIWADFTHYRDGRWRDRYWVDPHAPFPDVPDLDAGLPDAPRPAPAPIVAPTAPVLPTFPVETEPVELVPFEPVITPLSVSVNGNPLNISGQPSIMMNGVSMIPIGEVFRSLGYSIQWDGEALAATMRINKAGSEIEVVITQGSRSFTINGVSRNLRVPATIVNDHMMVPFVEIIESLGGRAHRDMNGTVNIFKTAR